MSSVGEWTLALSRTDVAPPARQDRRPHNNVPRIQSAQMWRSSPESSVPSEPSHESCLSEHVYSWRHHDNEQCYEMDEDMPDAAPVASRKPRNRVGFDPAAIRANAGPRPPPSGRPGPDRPRPPQYRTAPAAPQRNYPPPRYQNKPPPTSNAAFSLVDHLNATAACITCGELLSIAPTVRQELVSALQNVSEKSSTGPGQNNFFKLQKPQAAAAHTSQHQCYYEPQHDDTQQSAEPLDKYASQHYRKYDAMARGTPGISVVKAPVRVCGNRLGHRLRSLPFNDEQNPG